MKKNLKIIFLNFINIFIKKTHYIYVRTEDTKKERTIPQTIVLRYRSFRNRLEKIFYRREENSLLGQFLFYCFSSPIFTLCETIVIWSKIDFKIFFYNRSSGIFDSIFPISKPLSVTPIIRTKNCNIFST